jgi:murein DD-endopeptidase MepM/ murein hydrolase activator NlpD
MKEVHRFGAGVPVRKKPFISINSKAASKIRFLCLWPVFACVLDSFEAAPLVFEIYIPKNLDSQRCELTRRRFPAYNQYTLCRTAGRTALNANHPMKGAVLGLHEGFVGIEVAQVHYYKRIENYLVRKVQAGFVWLLRWFGGFFRTLGRFLVRDYTVVLVPHSEKKIYNFHIRFFALFAVFILFFGMAGVFFLYSASLGNARGGFSERDNRLKETQADLERLREEVNQLSRSARGFEAVLSRTLSALGADPVALAGTAGDRPSLFAISGEGDASREVEDLRQLSGYLSSAMEPVREIGTILDSQSAILSEIPSIWPIRGGVGHITQRFGVGPDPFTGMAHMHTGYDISTFRQGDPVVATADGQIALIAYEPNGFGNYIIMRHQHGFYTRYAHMLSFRVEAGQQVKQGEVIGYVGNTGRSTGPHLHYEVHIGSDVVDPSKYLNIRPNPPR